MASAAMGDRVTLKDGRTFEGSVLEEGGWVYIEMPYGTIRFGASEIESVERMPSPAEQFQTRLAELDRENPEALTDLAVWARAKGLTREADDLLTEAIALDADSARARRLLGYLEVDGKWVQSDEGLRLASARLEAGKLDGLLDGLLPALAEVIDGEGQQLRLAEIEAHALLRTRAFAEATEAFAALARKAQGERAVRFAAIASLLDDHEDGVYILDEPSPAVAMLLDKGGPAVESGPASLSRPEVLKAAVHDLAKQAIRDGQDLMKQGKELETVEPEAAKAKYVSAEEFFDRADALVAKPLARSWRIEIVRRRISLITKDMNTQAARFDALKAQLGARDLSPQAYAALVVRMVRALDTVREDLDAILALAAPYERELILDITDAKLRRQRISALRTVLMDELRDLDEGR
jgi:hypothetical protein